MSGLEPSSGLGKKKRFGSSFSLSSSFFSPVSHHSTQVGAENEIDNDQFAGSGKVFFKRGEKVKKEKKEKNLGEVGGIE